MNEHYFDSYGCPPPKMLTKYIVEIWRKNIFFSECKIQEKKTVNVMLFSSISTWSNYQKKDFRSAVLYLSHEKHSHNVK